MDNRFYGFINVIIVVYKPECAYACLTSLLSAGREGKFTTIECFFVGSRFKLEMSYGDVNWCTSLSEMRTSSGRSTLVS